MAERRKLHKSQEYIQGNTVRKLQPDRVPERRRPRRNTWISFGARFFFPAPGTRTMR